jgi:IS4 transposase
MIKYIKNFIGYFYFIKLLSSGKISDLYQVRSNIERMIKRREEQQTRIDKVVPDIERMLFERCITKEELIKALKQKTS